MATDYRRLVAELLAFYDFKGKTIISVGAGGGQLIEFARETAKVLALDNDAGALEALRENLRIAGLEDRFAPILGDFFQVELKGDVVYFEFSLHEMRDPGVAVERGLRMAPAVVVFDHWPGSEWSYITGEDNKVAASWTALRRLSVQKEEMHEAVQSFNNYEELFQKVKGQGEPSLSRIARYRGQTGIRIPMSYGLALISG